MNPLRLVFGPQTMIPSNLVAWYLVWTAHESSSAEMLRSSVSKIALFYTSWALFNILSLGRDDLGAVTFGILFLCTVLPEGGGGASAAALRDIAGFLARFRVAACVLLVLNFSVVFPAIHKAGGLWAFAGMVWNEDGGPPSFWEKVWALVFVSYITSNVVLWSFGGYLFFRLDPRYNNNNPPGVESYYDSKNYTTPVIQQNEYQPIQNV